MCLFLILPLLQLTMLYHETMFHDLLLLIFIVMIDGRCPDRVRSLPKQLMIMTHVQLQCG